jgi:primary-amine oxidase
VVERTPSPLNPLTADEINATVAILKAAGKYQPGYRFTEISLKTSPKSEVWNFALTGEPVRAHREAAVVILDGKKVTRARSTWPRAA